MQRKANKTYSKINFLKKGPIYRSLFRNGLAFLFHEAKGFSGARVNINILAGSYFEKENEYGLAHLLEHLIFKENKSQYLKQLEASGAEINAYTYKESICFEMGCLTDKVEELIPLFIKLVTKLDFTHEQFEKEKKIVIQELKEDADDHESAGLEYLFQKNFDATIGHPIGGAEKTLKTFSEENINDYFKRFFKPNRMIISVVAGDDIRDSIENIIKSEIHSFKACKPIRFKTTKRAKKIKHFSTTQKKPVESSVVFFSFQGPTISSDNYYDYVILDDFLFEGLSSRFFRKFREENAYVYGLGSSLNPFYNTGNYIMVFNSQTEHLKAIENGVREVLRELSENPLDDGVVETIKSRIIDGFKIGLDSLEERIELIQDNEIYSLDEYSNDALIQKLDKVTPKTVQKLCKKLYTVQSSILRIIPKD